MQKKFEGGCQCGDVRYSIEGDPVMSALCHCTQCRRAHAAPAVAWAMFADAQVRFTNGTARQFQSSAEAQRGFCARCGSQITFTADYLPGLIDIAIGSLDDPEAIAPTLHCWHSEQLSWADFKDELPRHPEFPPQDEESG